MSDIGKAWVDGVREPSYAEVENRAYHEKYSEMRTKEFNERIQKLAPLLEHPRDERGGIWISAFDFESRFNKRHEVLSAKKDIEKLSSFVPAGKEILMCEGYYFTLQRNFTKQMQVRYFLQLHHKLGAAPLFYLETGENEQAYLSASMLATLENLIEKYPNGIEGIDADAIKKTFNFKA